MFKHWSMFSWPVQVLKTLCIYTDPTKESKHAIQRVRSNSDGKLSSVMKHPVIRYLNWMIHSSICFTSCIHENNCREQKVIVSQKILWISLTITNFGKISMKTKNFHSENRNACRIHSRDNVLNGIESWTTIKALYTEWILHVSLFSFQRSFS